ncbi:major facilitator superfamily transporter [Stachybotrys elegans]|uniref:Major facilitator superfamily transporter n=1 Tax=Stachybotrys elegans TaxID=80388 RepID=A0A8K0SGS6_9HYPO|nr:major facilitator superfamily transporter [Stachybotrys elegans]
MASVDEKAAVFSQHESPAVSQHENASRDASHLEGATQDVDHGLTPAEQRHIIRRIDKRLVVMLGAMYCVSLMDRTNMSAAAIAGMREELHLVNNNNYNIANLVFFVPYILFQPPSTVLIRLIGSRIHLSVITLLWGAVMIGMGFTQNHGQLTACRALLGILEAGFFPSAVYLLSTWFTRYEVGKRYSVFYLLGSVASAASGILAYGLMQMGRLDTDLTGWRWIFIMEGVLTCVIALLGYWLLVDFPDSKRKSWRWLSSRETAWIVSRIQRDRGDTVTPPFNLRKFIGGSRDWKVWSYALMFCFSTTQSYALAFTLPIILVGNLGFDVGQAQCLVAPPFIFSAITMSIGGWFGDKYRMRGPIVVVNMLLAIIGLFIMAFHSSAAVRYFGTFLVTGGANANVPLVLTWQANNIRGQWKRAFSSAVTVAAGGVGGIAGSLVFREQDRMTGYRPGLYACITCCALNIIIVGILEIAIKRDNTKADRGEKVLELDEGETTNDFRYTR